ncbi:hypothetical protein PRIPAC_74448, partial [Pristionchus pacificus]|uniref:Uncharacterized protein n=1 Tax=Pristionchus pacificus TaxID=54126 RepID=A0A2A6BEZ2_PRIPA
MEKIRFNSGCGSGGCVCEEGLVRHEGNCIPFERIPKPDKNCFKRFMTRHHLTLFPVAECPLFEACKSKGCGTPRCMCYPGYVRAANNDCIPKFFCSQASSFASNLLAALDKNKVKITTLTDLKNR